MSRSTISGTTARSAMSRRALGKLTRIQSADILKARTPLWSA